MKKALLTGLSLVLVAVVAVFGTLAYLTDSESAVNVMTVGNVSIVQNEQERVKDTDGNYTGALQSFTQDQEISPAVYLNGQPKESVIVGDYTIQMRDESVKNYIDKIVTVTNTGKSEAYVRTVIALPTAGYNSNHAAYNNWLHWNGISDTDTTPNNGWIWGGDTTTEWPGNAAGWDMVSGVTIKGETYDLYIATNRNVLEPGKTTAPNLAGFYLDSRVDCETKTDGTLNYFITIGNTKYDLGDLSDLNILVATQAVQADGFDSAWTALDAAFGDINQNNHPWTASYVSTFEQLKSAFEKGGEIILEDDIAVEEMLTIVAGTDVYLDMNGKTLTLAEDKDGNTPDPMMDVKRGAALTITGNGTIDLEAHYYASLMYPRGEVTIENGNFVRAAGGTGYGSYFVGISGSDGAAKLIIHGGYFDGGYYQEGDCFNNCRNLLNGSWGQYIRVYGGTFVGQNPAWGDEGMAHTCCPDATYCQAIFLEGQTRLDTEIPSTYSITEGVTADGRPTYTVNYSTN